MNRDDISSIVSKYYNKHKHKRISTGYWGTQGRFLDKVTDLFPKEPFKRYVDLTAGGCNNPIQIRSKFNVPITTNDYGYFSWLISKSILVDCWKPTVTDLTDAVDVEPIEGFIFSKRDCSSARKKYGDWNNDVRKWIDGFTRKNAGKAILLAGLGRTLSRVGMYRGLIWCGKMCTGKRVFDMTVEDMIREYVKNISGLTQFVAEPNGSEAINGLANDFVRTYDKFDGAVVYTNPAWPWSTKYSTGVRAENPYTVLSFEMAQTLKGGADQVGDPPWWPYDKDVVLKDIDSWVRLPLQKGAKLVTINTQSTNFPDPKEVGEYLKDKFVVVKETTYEPPGSFGTKKEGGNTIRFSQFWWSMSKEK